MKNYYVYYYHLNKIQASYAKETGELLPFFDALNITIEQKLYTKEKKIPTKRSQLSEEEFLYYIDHSQIDIQYYLNKNRKYTDSSLIPNNLDVFAIKHLIYKEQIIHPHNCFDIHFIYKGEACLIFEDEVKLVSEGEVCIFAPKSKYRIYPDNEDTIIITIYIRNSSFERLFFDAFTEYDLISLFIRNVIYNTKTPTNYLLFKATYLNDIKEIVQNIFIETNYKDNYSNNAAIGHTHLLLITILRNCQFVHSYKSFQNRKNDYFLEIIDYVQNNYQTVTIKDLSIKFHYNESYLSTLFVNYLGMNFSHIITNLKINHAKSLLTETNLTINEISEIVGYNNVDHFSKMFKKLNNFSPSIYRKKFNNIML